MDRRLARSAGGGFGEEKGDCVADTGCEWGGRWSADRRDERLGPSKEPIRLAMLGVLERAGKPGWGIGKAGTGGTPNAGFGAKAVGAAPRCMA